MNPLGLITTPAPEGLVALPAKLLACHEIASVAEELAAEMGLDPRRHRSATLVTCDQDDSLYVALDHATKFAEVDVVFGKSFYAGAAHSSGPYSGEVLGIIAGADPEHVREGVWALADGLETIHFHTFVGEGRPAFFAHVIGETGRYLAPLAGIEVGAPMAYLIAPPLEAVVGVDAALKAANVRLATWMPPPSETNFAGAYLVGDLADVEAGALAFVEAIREIVRSPLQGLRRPMRDRR